MIRRLLVVLVLVGAMAGVLFASAGRLDLPFFWGWLSVTAALVLANVLTADPELQQERVEELWAGGKDFWPMLLFVPPALLAQLVVAGLDVGRCGWSNVPREVQVAGLVGSAAAGALSVWAMAVNSFFVGTVRLQPERGHHVVTAGPYRCVRHPAYLGSIAGSIGTSLALGSWWSLAPLGVFVLMLVRRTALEDRFLRDELRGYAAYAEVVRSRLVPGLW